MMQSWNKYNRIMEAYKTWYPSLFAKTVECLPSGRYSILAELQDGTRVEFNNLDNTIRDVTKYYGQNHISGNNEEEWRKEFGRRLRRIMAERGINQEQLADMAGISRQMLTRYVRGNSTPSGYNLTRLSEILNCDVRELTKFNYIDEE